MGVSTLHWGVALWSKVQSLSRSWHKYCRRAHFYSEGSGRQGGAMPGGRMCHFERLERRWVTLCVWMVPLERNFPELGAACLSVLAWASWCISGSFTVAPHKFYFIHQHFKDRSLWHKQFAFPAPWEAPGPTAQHDSPMSTCAVYFLYLLRAPPGCSQASLLWSFMSPSSLLYTARDSIGLWVWNPCSK